MAAHVEFIFRPRNCFVRVVAWLIGAPTCGIIRSGPAMNEFGDEYDLSVFFVSPPVLFVPAVETAELKGLCSPVRFSHFKWISQAAAKVKLKIRWERHKPGGRIVKIDPK